ncbi:MAG: sugar ABC transporter permease, partial [Spirochaetales bacterium]|nr:sugar ABC transporter permease [Spirochaetales bacterium]
QKLEERKLEINNLKINDLKRKYMIYESNGNTEGMESTAKEIQSIEELSRENKLYDPLKIVWFDNFFKALKTGSEFIIVLARTLLWTVINLFFQITIGFLTALILNRKLKLKGFFRSILILPWVLPQLITVLIWKYLFHSQFGFINVMLTKIARIFNPEALIQIAWLQNPLMAFIAVIVVNIWIGIPFITLVATGALQTIPKELYECASMEGCSSWQTLTKITIPLVKSAMLPAFLMGIIWTFTHFNVVYLITDGGPNNATHIIATYMFKTMKGGTYNLASVYSIIVFLILLFIVLLNIKVTRALKEE